MPLGDSSIDKNDGKVSVYPSAEAGTVFYKKDVRCEGKEVSIIYKVLNGANTGSQYVHTCQKIFSDSVVICGMDRSKIARLCHNHAIDFYRLENRHSKIELAQIDLKNAPAREPLPALPASAGSGVSR